MRTRRLIFLHHVPGMDGVPGSSDMERVMACRIHQVWKEANYPLVVGHLPP